MCNSLLCMGIYLINLINDFSSSSSATMPSLAKSRYGTETISSVVLSLGIKVVMIVVFHSSFQVRYRL